MTISVNDFEYVRELVRDESALALNDSKQYLVETRLAPLAESQGLGSVSDLIGQLRIGAPGLRNHVVDALATNETLFLRDLHPFDALRQDVIPAVLAANGGRSLSMWSAAASTGQEAYSMAMLVRDHFPEVDDVTILATDISQTVLARAKTGSFSQLEVNRGLPASMLVKHFERHGREWQLNDDVRQMVIFRQLNLAAPFSGVPPMDVVFLRNVLIYFDDEIKSQVLGRVGKIMRPGGYLFLGGAETTYGLDDAYASVEVGQKKTISYRLVAPEEATHDHD